MTHQHTAGVRLRFLARTAVVLICTVLGFAAVPAAHAAPAYTAYLDLPAVNDDGSGAGGLNPALPLDATVLRSALDQARADGIAPSRYATLLHQYWLVVAVDNAGIELAAWDPGRGPAAGEHIFNQVYVNYLRLASQHPEFWWAALAGIAGGSFASGYFDMSDVGRLVDLPAIHQLGSAVADVLRSTPAELVRGLPADIHLLATEGPRLTADDLAWYQIRLMTMQKHIFLDLVPMHEAYLAEGLPGIEEMHRAGILDDGLRAAWYAVASGTRAGYIDALIRMTDREQNYVVADQWDATATGRGSMGRVLTYVSTVAGKAGVPGVRAPGVYGPATVTVAAGDRTISLRTPLPNWNWADRDARWAYITGDLVPRHIDMKSDPALATAVLAEPFWDKLARGRLLQRLPDVLADMTTQWQLTG
ncbi:hypothetical protein IU485_05865 [Nocardia cyriacigeorgica]|uniref:hypothetical protein n=1 Tax=Nocardia cyriacigeorgica TaxID=135487 RepID=UPI001895FF2E|nr:hypothetical protein [Nocardia cyriacigeorgica]MBF6080881.1 hypothetical protein [Nocardia cyriacigeorgica]